MIVPNPKKYPGGLRQYMKKFIADEKMLYIRAVGHELCHLSFGSGKFSFKDYLKSRNVNKKSGSEGGKNSLISATELRGIWDQYGYIEPPINWNDSILSQRR